MAQTINGTPINIGRNKISKQLGKKVSTIDKRPRTNITDNIREATS
ncbi:hypothetical protein [Kluyvera sp. CHPC 1.2972]